MCRLSRMCLTAQCLLVATLVCGLLLFTSGFASADIDPADCNTNNVQTAVTRVPGKILSGGMVAYSATLSNPSTVLPAIACNSTLTNNVILICPAGDGTPTGVQKTLFDIMGVPIDLDVGAPPFGPLGPVPCTITGDPGLYTARVQATGILHDSDPDQSTTLLQQDTTIEVVECFVAADCDPAGGVCETVSCPTVGPSANTCVYEFLSPTTICRASAGVCDVAESCTGSGALCPADGFATPTTICRASAGICDVAESCTGAGVQCPANDFKPDSSLCNDTDNNSCTVAGCESGSCVQSHTEAPAGTPGCGGQGCSPGYWKQCDRSSFNKQGKPQNQQHCHSYDETGTVPPAPPGSYQPETLFLTAFGVDAFPGQTLLQVLNLQGGGLNALGRHTVGALLNAALPDSTLNYDLGAVDVIRLFQCVFLTPLDPTRPACSSNNGQPFPYEVSGAYNALSAYFESLEDENGRICPLN